MTTANKKATSEKDALEEPRLNYLDTSREEQLGQYFNLLGLDRDGLRLRIWKGARGRTLAIGQNLPEGWSAGYPVNTWQQDRCLFIFAEDDGPDDLEVKKLAWQKIGLEPTFQVFSGNKSIHHYWRLDSPATPVEWQEMQKRLALSLGTDSSLSDLGQIMRVPGYLHPGTKSMAVVLDKPSKKSYAGDLVRAALKPLPVLEKRELKPMDLVAEDALGYLGRNLGPYQEGQGTYPDRLRIAEYLNDCAGGLEAWIQAFGDEGLGRPSAQQLFESFKSNTDNPATAGSIIWLAQSLGWQHPVTHAGSLEEIRDCKLAEFASSKDLEIAARNLEGKESKNLAELRAMQTEARISQAPKSSILSICGISDKGTLKAPVDSAAAKFLAEQWKDLYRFDRSLCRLYRWNDKHWEEAKKWELDQRISEALEVLGVSINYCNQVLSRLWASWPYALEPEKPGCIGFQNGFLNGEFRPHHPDNLNRSVLGFSYDPKADCPRIKSWLLWCREDYRPLVAVLRCALKGRPRTSQIFAEVTGVSKSGKSTFGNLCRVLAGSGFVHDTDPTRLERNRFELAALIEKRLIVLNDIARYGSEVSVLKSLSAGEQLTAELKGLDNRIPFVFQGLVLIMGEHTLKTSDYQSGIARRRYQIHFSKRVEGQARNLITLGPEITGEFAEELPGLVNLVLQMTEEECADVLSSPEDVNSEEFKAEQLAEQNPLAGFLMDKCEKNEGPELVKAGNGQSSEGLYHQYLVYCAEQVIQPVGVPRFGRDLLDVANNILGWKVFKKINMKGTFYGGIRIRA